MKKTLVAAGIIVALGAAWTGGAWYTGKQIETRLSDVIEQINADLAQNNSRTGLKLSWKDYQRGIFSSHLQIVAEAAEGVENSLLKPGQSVVLAETIYHGPFPLKKFSLMPAMAVVDSQLVKSNTSEQLFELAKGKSPFEVTTRINYSGATNSDIVLNPLNYEKENDKIAFNGGDFEFNADADGNVLSLTGSAGSGLLNVMNQYGQKVQFTFNNLKADGRSELTSFDERIGSQKLTLDKLAIAVEGKELAVLDGMTIAGKADLAKEGKSINSSLDYTLDSLKLQGNDMGSGKLALKIGQIDGEGWHQFSQQYNSQVQELLGQPQVMQNPLLYQEKVIDAFFNALPLLLKGEPVITIAPLSWKNSKGETALNLSLFLKDPTTSTVEPQTLAQELDTSVKSLDGKLAIPMDMATAFMTQIARIEGYQQADAEKLADQQVKGLAAMGQMFHLTTVQDNTIQTSLHYANGQVGLNGQKMALDQFINMFGIPEIIPPAPLAPQDVAPAEPQEDVSPAAQ